MTIIGGIIGLILGLIPSAASILIFNELYFICLMFTPILACLFMKLLGGHKNAWALVYSVVLSIISAALAGFMLQADVLIQWYELPKYEIIRLSALMIAEIQTYGPEVLATFTNNIFNIIILIGYITIGVLFSWSFIFTSAKKKEAEETIKEKAEASEGIEEEYEYEYVYEDELEEGDETVEEVNE